MSTKTKIRPDFTMGRKLPAFTLWERLQQQEPPLGLEFGSLIFNNGLSLPQAKKWLAERGIPAHVNTLSRFYHSLELRLRFASLQAAQSAETAKTELPTDIEAATRERIAQHKFELAFMNLSTEHKLQLIQIQQRGESAKGNIDVKQARLELDRQKFQRLAVKSFLDWSANETAKGIVASNLSQADKIEQLGRAMFGEDWATAMATAT